MRTKRVVYVKVRGNDNVIEIYLCEKYTKIPVGNEVYLDPCTGYASSKNGYHLGYCILCVTEKIYKPKKKEPPEHDCNCCYCEHCGNIYD